MYNCPSAREVVCRQRSRLADVTSVTKFLELPEYPSYPVYLTQFDNTLVVKSIEPQEGFKCGIYKILVWNVRGTDDRKVFDIDPVRHHVRSLKDQRELEVADIKLARDVMAVHHLFGQLDEPEGERSNETQLWRLDTADPEEAVLVRTVLNPLVGVDCLDPGLLALNSAYLVRIGTNHNWNVNNDQQSLIQVRTYSVGRIHVVFKGTLTIWAYYCFGFHAFNMTKR